MTQYELHPKFVYDAILDGRAYFISQVADIPADDTFNVHIRNPVDSTKDMWIVAIDISATSNTEIWLHDYFNSVTDGAEITIQNALLDSGGGAPDSGPFESYYDLTFTAAADASVPIGITESGPPSTETVSYFPQDVEEGREIIFEIRNMESNSQKGLISVFMVTPH